jgi:hypothetical protein
MRVYSEVKHRWQQKLSEGSREGPVRDHVALLLKLFGELDLF